MNLDSKRIYLAAVAFVVVLYLAAAFGSALTQRPWCDEAWNSSPALCLITNGYMGTPAIDPSGTWFPLTGINQYTYWIMPLHPLSQAPWYKVFGFGVLQMRAYSMAWGLVALASWFIIMMSLSGDRKLALLAITLIALDFVFIQRSSEGRMDIMSAALGFAALAAYLRLRERRLTLAVFVSHTLMAASCFTHPNALMHFLGLIFITLYFDRRRLQWQIILVAVVPYVAGALCWGLYISKAPELFRIQLSGNATGRFQGFKSPLTYLKLEFTERHLRYLAGFAPDLSRAHRLKVFVLIAYAAGVVGTIAVGALRRHSGNRVLLALTAINLLFLTFWDGSKNPLYLIHIVPLFAVVLAVWVRWCWERRVIPRWMIAAGVCAFLAVQLGGVAYVIARDNYGKTYMPAVAFLKQNAPPGASIMGSAELGFELGFFDNLTDDVKLGYESGKTPDFIVVETRYEEWFENYKTHEPEIHQFITNRLAREYRPVYVNPPYTIYTRAGGVNAEAQR